MADVSGAIQGVAGIASAFGGGGGGGGGTVVGGPTPAAAMQAGQYQMFAAQAAAEAAKKATSEAIAAINKNYAQARYDVQPYRTAGVQALNELNQYLGLDAYNPGAAPKTPVKPTLEGEKENVSFLDKYMRTMMYTSGTKTPSGFNALSYGGPLDSTQSYGQTQTKAGKEWGYKGAVPVSLNPGGGSVRDLMTLAPVMGGVTNEIATENYKEAMKTYEQDYTEWERNQAEWQQNMDWYNEYQAQGPLTSQQVVDKISNQPGYQAELSQGVDAISKASSAAGYLGSGRVLKELNTFGQNTLSKYYNNTLDRLSQVASQGAQAANYSGQVSMNKGNNIASAKIGLGDTLANAALASGNAMAQATLAANQQYKVIGGSSGGK